VFDPRTIIRYGEASGLHLQQLTVIGAGGAVRTVQPTEDALQELAQSRYNLGIFVFIKRDY
jgi:hypothetical protein